MSEIVLIEPDKLMEKILRDTGLRFNGNPVFFLFFISTLLSFDASYISKSTTYPYTY